jgi:hypothetical protein
MKANLKKLTAWLLVLPLFMHACFQPETKQKEDDKNSLIQVFYKYKENSL